MYPRYLMILAMLVFSRLISYGQFDSPVNPDKMIIDPNLIIQVGAFRQEQNASVLKDKLSRILDQHVTIVPEDGFFKVRITGFSDQEEMEKLYPTLAFLGLKNFWVLPVRKQEEIEPQDVVQPDTAKEALNENPALSVIAEDQPVVSQPDIVLQVDVFHNKSDALNAQKRITSELKLPVEIVQEWEYYKVFITGFKTTEEARNCYPALAKLGYPKISLIENYKKK